MTSMRARMVLSKSEIEKNTILGHSLSITREVVRQLTRIPITILSMLGSSATTVCGELNYVPKEVMYMMQGKAMTQMFLE